MDGRHAANAGAFCGDPDEKQLIAETGRARRGCAVDEIDRYKDLLATFE
jgi:hypothetical protein